MSWRDHTQYTTEQMEQELQDVSLDGMTRLPGFERRCNNDQVGAFRLKNHGRHFCILMADEAQVCEVIIIMG